MDTLESKSKGLKGLGYKVGADKDGRPKLSKERIRRSKGRKSMGISDTWNAWKAMGRKKR